jgi:hypothetical protein
LADTQNPTGYDQPTEATASSTRTTYIVGRILGQAETSGNVNSYLLVDRKPKSCENRGEGAKTVDVTNGRPREKKAPGGEAEGWRSLKLQEAQARRRRASKPRPPTPINPRDAGSGTEGCTIITK